MTKRHRLSALMVAFSIFLAGCSGQSKAARYVDSAKKLDAQGKYSEAMLQYRNALRFDPNLVEASVGFAKLLLQQRDLLGAEAELRKLVRSAPQSLEAHRLLAQTYILGRQAEGAETESRAALQLKSDDPESGVLLGDALLLKNQRENAEEAFREVLKDSPNNVDAWLGISGCRNLAHDPAGTEQALRSAVQGSSGSSETLLLLAAFLERQGRTSEAEDTLKHAEAHDPQSVPVLLAAASFYFRRGDRGTAEAKLIRVRESASPNSLQRLALADYYISRHDNNKAAQELRDIITRDGYGSLAVERLGNLLLDTQQFAEADALVSTLLSKDKHNVHALFLQGRRDLAQGNPSAALNKFTEIEQSMPKVAALYHYKGLAHLAQKQPELAHSDFNHALDLDTNFGPARVERAKLELDGHDDKAALEDAQLAAQRWPTAVSWSVLVKALIANGKQAVAEQVLTQLIAGAKEGPLRANFRAQSAYLAFQQGAYAKGRSELEQAETDDPAAVYPDEMMMASFVMQRQLDNADRVLNRAEARFPDNRELQLLQGELYLREAKYAEADKVFQGILTTTPEDVTARLGLALGAAGRKDWATAAGIFEQLGSSKGLAQALVQAGQAREQAAGAELARKDYQEALRLDPNNVVALNNLSFLLLKTAGNVDQAVGYAEHAEQLSSNSPEITDTLAWAYYHKNRYAYAVDLLHRAIAAEPQNGTYYYHLAKCYEGLGERQEAREAFTKALNLNGSVSREEVRRELESLKAGQ
jgi:tetratricopeptide (TPR) repeat protein